MSQLSPKTLPWLLCVLFLVVTVLVVQVGTALDTRAKRKQPPSPASVEKKVKEIMLEQLGLEPKDLRDNASIVKDLGADELDVVELVMALEEAFEIEISDQDVEKLKTVRDVVRYVLSRIDQRAAGSRSAPFAKPTSPSTTKPGSKKPSM